MANGAALIRETLWRDKDFRQLPRTAQCLYLQLLSQKDLDCAGILTLHPEILAKGCDEMTVADVWHDLKTLTETRFIVVDTDTDSVLIRSYLRHVTIKSPNAWKAAQRVIKRLQPGQILSTIAGELHRLGRADATDLATIITAARTPSESHPDPIPIPSVWGIPSGSHPDGSVSVPVSVPPSPLVDGWVGRAPDGATPCPKHPQGPKHDEPCRDCQRIRERQQRDLVAAAAAEDEARAARRATIDACPYCEPTGMRETPDGLKRCTHNPDTFDEVF